MVKVVMMSLVAMMVKLVRVVLSGGNDRRRVPMGGRTLKRFKVVVVLLLLLLQLLLRQVLMVVVMVRGSALHATESSSVSRPVVQRMVDVVKVGQWRSRCLHLLGSLSTSF